MLSGRNGRRNAGPRRGNSTPIGTRNIPPREPVVLPDEDEARGGDFYDCEWEHHRPARSALSIFLDEDEDDEDDLAEAAARARLKREQAQLAEAQVRAGQEAAQISVDENDAVGDPPGPTDSAGAGDRTVPAAEPEAEPRPLTAEEVRRRRKRDERICKWLPEADKNRFRKVVDPTGLAGEPGYAVVCYGAFLRLTREEAFDAYEELHNTPLNEPLEDRQARLKEAMAAVGRWGRKIAAYGAWVAEHRPEWANGELVELLAGLKADRATAKARIAELDKKYRTGPGATAGPTAPPTPAGPLPLIYQKEIKGRVRAYPEWVAPVLRRVAHERSHQIPAMAFVLAQLAYWLEPDEKTGQPRARRTRLIHGKWWVVLGYGQIEKQTPVSQGQAKRAIKSLRASNLIETLTAKQAGGGSEAGGVDFGPNTVFLRVNTEVLDPLVKEVLSV